MNREQINQAMRDANDRTAQLEVIRAAAIKANPEIEKREMAGLDVGSGRDIFLQDDTIRLADVLLAIQTLRTDYNNGALYFGGKSTAAKGGNAYFEYGPSWNLRQDDVIQQSDECIFFLYNLLK